MSAPSSYVVGAALGLVTALTQAAVGGADGASVMLALGGELTTVAATDETIAQIDRDQRATGEGPCLAAATQGRWFHVESVAEEVRWPHFVLRAREEGIGSILSSPLMDADARPIGALNVYSTARCAFGPTEQAMAALFASHASRILALSDAADEATRPLQDSLRAREVIAQAQGVVMERLGVSAEAAHAILRRTSEKTRIPVRSKAAEIVASTQRQGSMTASRL